MNGLIAHSITTLAEGSTPSYTSSSVAFLQPGYLLDSLSVLIPLFPYIAFFVILFIGNWKKNENWNHNISILANIGSFIVAIILFTAKMFEFLSTGGIKAVDLTFYNWAPPIISNGWTISIGFLIDPLSIIMFTLVSFLSLLIQIYGKGYMHGEKGVTSGRYNAEISLFVGSMLLLALSANHLVFFIGWELMGLCSYLLIGFFLDKDVKEEGKKVKNAPSSAAKKAFLVTKVGDVLLMAGFALIFFFMINAKSTQPLDFLAIRTELAGNPALFAYHGYNYQTLVAFLLFGGAVGKSAQFPLHVWLPDAMEGPTTVSALIHSATMVKAGVFLVARNYYLFQGTDALQFVGLVGGFTAIFAATMAFVADDIKRVLAYSTISQLGYMFLGLGAGSLTGGMFHLISHSFFKCLLFLDAGSLIHAVHSNDMHDMGGLKDKMPWTFRTMLVGGLGLSGFVFFNGFYSKDAVISAAGIQYANTGNWIYGFMFISGLITALLTAFYTFRMIFTVFWGKPKYDEEHVHPHESGSLMKYPLIVLASVVLGSGILSTEGFIRNMLGRASSFSLFGNLNIFNEYTLEHLFESWYITNHLTSFEQVNPVPATGSWMFWLVLMPFIALVFVIIGIALAYIMYSPKGMMQNFPASLNKSSIGKPISTLLKEKYYMDTFYIWLAQDVVGGGIASIFWGADRGIDWVVDRTGRATKWGAGVAKSFDDNYIDGTVRKLSNGTFAVGRWLRKQQSGVLQDYNQQLVLGIIALMIIILGLFYIIPYY